MMIRVSDRYDTHENFTRDRIIRSGGSTEHAWLFYNEDSFWGGCWRIVAAESFEEAYYCYLDDDAVAQYLEMDDMSREDMRAKYGDWEDGADWPGTYWSEGNGGTIVNSESVQSSRQLF